ncbi:hypothetical protein B0H16DRAFT_1479275 [Mycena metata]|uniref:Uncharacterized protein n=1 Tax=Mycena metata TaxID=1033252 RepID=A0AAD7H546_9AGAR|nr:hypothetical protein B0H16DRAFT_1479275 [Mycena metata]
MHVRIGDEEAEEARRKRGEARDEEEVSLREKSRREGGKENEGERTEGGEGKEGKWGKDGEGRGKRGRKRGGKEVHKYGRTGGQKAAKSTEPRRTLGRATLDALRKGLVSSSVCGVVGALGGVLGCPARGGGGRGARGLRKKQTRVSIRLRDNGGGKKGRRGCKEGREGHAQRETAPLETRPTSPRPSARCPLSKNARWPPAAQPGKGARRVPTVAANDGGEILRELRLKDAIARHKTHRTIE